MLTVVCFVFRSKAECRQWCALCSGEKREAALTKMLTVVCFVFRGKAGGGSDEDADSGVLYLRDYYHPIRHAGLLQDTDAWLPSYRSARYTFVYSPQNV